MAEHGKGGIFTNASKKLKRTKTKVLQNLGKAERTTDDVFDELVQKLDRQQDVSNKFQKELRNYMHCAKAMSIAVKSFHTVLSETYEQEWAEEVTVKGVLESVELMWVDYLQKLQDRVQEPLTTYLGHFNPLRVRISKRGRKLVDYDNARHNLDVIQNAKKKDEGKLQKAQEDMLESKRIYEEMNKDLRMDLPDLNNSRVTFYAKTFHELFSAESTFHSELGGLNENVSNIAERLHKNNEEYVYNPPQRSISKAMSHDSHEDEDVHRDENALINGHHDDREMMNDHRAEKGNSGYGSESPATTPTQQRPRQGSDSDSPPDEATHGVEESGIYENEEFKDAVPLSPPEPSADEPPPQKQERESVTYEVVKAVPEDDVPKVNGDVAELSLPKVDVDLDIPPEYPPPAPPQDEPSPASEAKNIVNNLVDAKYDSPPDDDSENEDSLYQRPMSNKLVEGAQPEVQLPPGTLFQVQATHPYTGEDADELTFEAGELIYVMPFANPDEQDEGWLLGQRKSDGKKGVFPENFTVRI